MPAEPTKFWCGPDAPARQAGPQAIHLNTHSPNDNVLLQFESIARLLVKELTPEALDVLEIASYVYCADQCRSRGGKAWSNNGEDWNRSMSLDIAVRNPDRWNDPETMRLLTEGISFLSDDNFDFHFRPLTRELSSEHYFVFDEGQPWFEAESIVLFSGGLDSLAGAVQETIGLKQNTVLVSHRPASQIAGRQDALVRGIRELPGQTSKILHIPIWVNKEKTLTKDVTQRCRSFLYAGLAAAVASMMKITPVKFYENGIVSCNLAISPQLVGARASRSTHPRVLKFYTELFSRVLNSRIEYENPYLWQTKSEIVQDLAGHGAQSLIDQSRSCTHTRTTQYIGSHCGVCSQCIERFLSTRAAGLAQFDPDELYEKHLFLGGLKNGPERALAESYFSSAREWEQMSPETFFGRYPEAFRIIESVGSISQSAQQLFKMHQRQARQMALVASDQIRQHADHIRRGEVETSSLLAMMLKRASHDSATAASIQRFPTPDGTDWKDIQITLVSNSSVKVKVGSIVKTFTGFDIGFRDNRKGDLLNKQWELLCDLAEQGGQITWNSPKAKEGRQKQVQHLSRIFRQFFGIHTLPFHPYNKKTGYVAKFRIRDDRPFSR